MESKDILRKIRETNHLTQEEMVARLFVTRQAVSRWEPGKMIPEVYLEIIKYPTEHILRYWDEHSPNYNRFIFEHGAPYNFEYFQDFIPYLKDRSLADKLTSILRQTPTAFMELDFAKSKNKYVHLPCYSINSPDNIIYPVVQDLVNASLDYRMKQQSKDGHWPLGWPFGNDVGLQKLQVKYEAYRTLLYSTMIKMNYRIRKIA